MQSEATHINPVLVEIKVEVPWERVERDLDGAFGKLQRTARIRGFRPGKAPRSALRKVLGKEVRREVTANLVQEGLAEAVREHSLFPVAMPEIDPPNFKQGSPLTFRAQLEVRPKLESIDTASLELERRLEPVANEHVNRQLLRLREQHASIEEPSTRRPSTKGDILTVDYVVRVDGEVQEELGASDREIEVGSERLLPEFAEGLVGLQVGQDATLTIHFDKEHPSARLRNKQAQFEVKVKELRERVLPELDDEFARDCGDFDSLQELTKDVRKRLEAQASDRAQTSLRRDVIDALVEKNPIPVPPSLVKQEREAMARELQELRRQIGAPAASDDDEELLTRAERKVRAAILFGALADREQLKVTRQELDAKLEELATRTGKHVAKLRADFQGERLESLESQLLEDKLLEYLLSQATIREASGAAGSGEQATSDTGASSPAEGGTARDSQPEADASPKEAD